VVSFGIENGYFVGDEGFACSPQRAKVTKKARIRAAAHDAEVARVITLDVCPTVADVMQFAAAFEVEYPGYGFRLVLLAFATGLRLCELLALRWDSIDLVTGAVAVNAQLDRYRAWPAVRKPKGGKTRTAEVWTCYLDVAESLVADAVAREGEDHGWLFPRHRSTTSWAEQAGKLAGAAIVRVRLGLDLSLVATRLRLVEPGADKFWRLRAWTWSRCRFGSDTARSAPPRTPTSSRRPTPWAPPDSPRPGSPARLSWTRRTPR